MVFARGMCGVTDRLRGQKGETSIFLGEKKGGIWRDEVLGNGTSRIRMVALFWGTKDTNTKEGIEWGSGPRGRTI